MGRDEKDMAPPKQLPALRPSGKGLLPPRDAPIDAKGGPTLHVRVRRRGERRRDHLRRYWFRGVDELRRQQAGDDPPKPPPRSLNVLI
jgi:hypothetical protein